MNADEALLRLRLRWSRVPVVVWVVVTLTAASQCLAVTNATWRPWILAASVPVLDALGALYAVRAARRGGLQATWWLVALGRTLSVLATLLLVAHAFNGDAEWSWLGTACRLLMFAALAAAVVVPLRHVYERDRRAFMADLLTVLSFGFMPLWYFVISPVVEDGRPDMTWLAALGYPLGDLLLLVAVSALTLRRATARLQGADGLLVAGLALYAVADGVWSSAGTLTHAAGSTVATLAMVLACLLLTLAPMVAADRRKTPMPARQVTDVATWPMHLPGAALGSGGLLMLFVSIKDNHFFPWGGMVLASLVMKAAIADRQYLFVRDSRAQITSDALTGLTNRVGLDQALQRLFQRPQNAAVLLIDLDGFKQVNDVYGHAAGDALLVHFAGHMRGCTRRDDVVARIGGDEFAVLLTDVATAGQAATVAQRIIAAAEAAPVDIDGDSVPVLASIGVAVLAGEHDTPKELLRRADIAMYHAKRSGNHEHAIYDDTMVDRRALDAELGDELVGAVAERQVQLLYQPIVELHEGRIVGVEALARWQHPHRGLIGPGLFIPLAERHGHIHAIGLQVLEQTCLQLRQWLRMEPERPLYASVNLSPRQLQEPTVVHDILGVLHRTGVAAEHILLEVTESATVDAAGMDVLRALRSHGLRIAIDDFGTGYSSLHYLTRLPADILKIDRSFVGQLDSTPAGAATAEAVIRLAQVLGLSTIAEGVETTDQVSQLLALGCSIGQGYLFAQPQSASTITELLAQQTPAPQVTDPAAAVRR